MSELSHETMANRPISPTEPTKKHPTIQPNAHPYAIKTTSSALLSRPSPSPHYANYMKHHYVPPPTSPVTAGRVRHRHSTSISAVEGEVHNGARAAPAPLPAPPPTLVASTDNSPESVKHVVEPKLTSRMRRAKTMPSGPNEPIKEHENDDQKWHEHHHDQDTRLVGLPLNPKQWNTDELVTYLETSLGSGNSTTDARNNDTAIVDILDYVRTRSLTGRELLQLADGDLADTPLSDAQRVQLLERSRTLRTNVPRGRDHVDSYHSRNVSDNSNVIHSLPARAASIRGGSMSADDLCVLAETNTGDGSTALPPSPAMTLNRTNSVSEASAQRYRDLARMRMRRRGRVKGLVETWERAGTSSSECSTSEEESVSGSEADQETESIPDTDDSPERSSDLSSDPQDAARSPLAHLTGASQEPPSLTPPPPYTHVCPPLDVDGEEEPTVEELLASSSSVPLQGARAWEADFGLGETVKRVPLSLDADAESPRALSIELGTTHDMKSSGQRAGVDFVRSRSKRSSVRGSVGRGEKKTQNRVVTAIFTGSPSEGVSESIGNEEHLGGDRCRLRGVPASSDLQDGCDGAIRALEASIAVTRAQLDAFRARLEQVETDTIRQEAELRRAQCSDAHHTLGSRRRQSEASVQTAEEVDDTPGDETLATHPKDKDVVNMWEDVPLSDITRVILAKTMWWLFPNGRPSARAHDNKGQSLVRAGSFPGSNDKCATPAERGGRLAVQRMSCSIILISFAICTAVLGRMGFGRWSRGP